MNKSDYRMENTVNTIEVKDVTEPGWYMSADSRLNENMIFRATTDTLDGKLRWHVMFANGMADECNPGYIDQAGGVVRVTRPIE